MPPISTKPKRQRHIALEIQVLAWERYLNVADLNRLMGFHSFSSDK
jgi:hypothetical protein